MMTGTDGDPLLIEHAANVFRAESVEHEREDARLFLGGANHSKTGDPCEMFFGVNEQFMLVALDVHETEGADVVERGPESHGVCDVPRARFEAARRPAW